MTRDPSTRPRHIEAQLHFLPTEAGGRAGPAYSGYRPQFFYQGKDWDAQHFYPDVMKVPPGASVRAFLTFLSPALHIGHISVGMPFLIREGQKTVAYGSVLAVLDLLSAAAGPAAAGGDGDPVAPAG